MIGLIFYAGCSLGFALYFPSRSRSGFRLAGINLVTGYALTVLSLYVWAVIFHVDNGPAVYLTCLGALGGIGIWMWRGRTGPEGRGDALNWVFPVLLLGAAAILANGGVGYIPTTDDEFTLWIGMARIIHFAENFEAVKYGLEHQEYLPGWRLMLMAPWQFSGTVNMGSSAAAPFVLYVAVLAALYDLAVHWAEKHWRADARVSVLCGLGVVFLFAAAEGLGRVWPLYLLIEPPQIMTYAAIVLALLAADTAPEDIEPLWRRAGIILAASVLLKTAAMIWIPGLAVAAYVVCVRASGSLFRLDWLRLAKRLAWGIGPAFLFFVSWRLGGSFEISCVGSVDGLLIGGISSILNDWTAGGFLGRFGATIGGYIVSYKTALFAAAVAGIVISLVLGTGLASVAAFFVFAFGYFLFLYFANLVCWLGGVEELTSYQRYSRVAVQTFHALGLALLVHSALVLSRRWSPALIKIMQRGHLGWVMIAALVSWQAWQIHGSVADLDVRTRWPADVRIGDMRNAVAFARERSGKVLPAKPTLLVLDQGHDKTPAKYAHFFAMERGAKGPEAAVNVLRQVSFSPTRGGIEYDQVSRDHVLALIARADVIWIRRLDDWMLGILAEAKAPADCRAVLVRDKTSGAFNCVEKTAEPDRTPG